MQSVHTRMRRAVQKENRDIDAKIGAGNNNDNTKSKRKGASIRPSSSRGLINVNCGLLILVLSPILIIGTFICVSRQYAILSTTAAQAELNDLTPGDAAGREVTLGIRSSPDSLSKLNRLRNGRQVDKGEVKKNSAPNNDQAKKLGEQLRQKIIEQDEQQRQKQKQEQEQEQQQQEQQQQQQNNKEVKVGVEETTAKKFLVLTTKHGNIKITLRPDLSPGSVDYIHKLVESYGGNGKRCMHCNFYRSEKPGILQGIMEHKDVVPINEVLGVCPPGSESVKNDCPEWDEACGCHGPVMARGAVAWAAGQSGGPDFFIDGYPTPAKWWGTQHTNFGFIDDKASLKILDFIFDLPIESTAEMDFLKDKIHFDLILE